MHRPIAIPMEDDIIHTQEHPYCDDPACPCHTQAHERAANVPHQPARRKARRKSGAARGKKKAAARR